MNAPQNKPQPVTTNTPGKAPICTCGQDPFADLPPELRPQRPNTLKGLRKVTCPGCGLKYWTNRNTDVCIDCEKKGVKPLETQSGD
jgi:hypothetical protein